MKQNYAMKYSGILISVSEANPLHFLKIIQNCMRPEVKIRRLSVKEGSQ
jgi:hypothetical protein